MTSSSSSISISSGYSSASNESTRRVIEINKKTESTSSSETLSCMKTSSEEVVDIDVEEKDELAEQKLKPRLGYEWVHPKRNLNFAKSFDNVQPSSRVEATENVVEAEAGPSKKARKREKSAKKSHSSKRHRHGSRSSSQYLFETVFTSSTRFSDFVHTSHDASSRDMFSSATIPSLTNSVIELASRTLLIGKAIREKTKDVVSSFELEKLKKEATESNEKIGSLTSQVEDLSKAKDCYEVEKESLKDEVAELTAQKLSLDDEIQRLKGNFADLSAAKKAEADNNLRLESVINQLNSRVTRAKGYVVQQHKLGFQKALQQAKYFYKIPLDAGNFDVGKDFYNGELIPISEIPY
ncbi:COP1-interactive protein 1-like [Phaseolus vulgaris]|uniref:COP1-interactive protein 1-like n=1 Tax=Phaseolus vulgaris TaxID=3885 RepID=UPI0035C99A41